MKTHKKMKVIALVLMLCMVFPQAVWAENNGDGYTPYNLKWLEHGIISYEKQQTWIGTLNFQGIPDKAYRLELFLNGEKIGAMTIGNQFPTETFNISERMTQNGDYYFTMHACEPPNTEIAGGVVAVSPVYTYSGGSAGAAAQPEETGQKPELTADLIAEFTAALQATAGTPDAENYIRQLANYNITPLQIAELFGLDPDYVQGILGSGAPAEAAPAPMPQETPGTPVSAIAAMPTASAVYVDGLEIAFDAYNINGSNYFKLRDLAYVLNGSSAQFDVGWDSQNNAIDLILAAPYSGANEMTGPKSGEKAAVLSEAGIFVDGDEVSLTAYNIDGNNYFMLRELGGLIGFAVDWDGENNAVTIDTGDSWPDDEYGYGDGGQSLVFDPEQFVEGLNRILTANGYGILIIDAGISRFAQEQVDSYVSKNDEAGNVYGEGDNRDYYPVLTYSIPKGIPPMALLDGDDDTLSGMHNLHNMDETGLRIGIAYGEMGDDYIIHIIGKSR